MVSLHADLLTRKSQLDWRDVYDPWLEGGRSAGSDVGPEAVNRIMGHFSVRRLFRIDRRAGSPRVLRDTGKRPLLTRIGGRLLADAHGPERLAVEAGRLLGRCVCGRLAGVALCARPALIPRWVNPSLSKVASADS